MSNKISELFEDVEIPVKCGKTRQHTKPYKMKYSAISQEVLDHVKSGRISGGEMAHIIMDLYKHDNIKGGSFWSDLIGVFSDVLPFIAPMLYAVPIIGPIIATSGLALSTAGKVGTEIYRQYEENDPGIPGIKDIVKNTIGRVKRVGEDVKEFLQPDTKAKPVITPGNVYRPEPKRPVPVVIREPEKPKPHDPTKPVGLGRRRVRISASKKGGAKDKKTGRIKKAIKQLEDLRTEDIGHYALDGAAAIANSALGAFLDYEEKYKPKRGRPARGGAKEKEERETGRIKKAIEQIQNMGREDIGNLALDAAAATANAALGAFIDYETKYKPKRDRGRNAEQREQREPQQGPQGPQGPPGPPGPPDNPVYYPDEQKYSDEQKYPEDAELVPISETHKRLREKIDKISRQADERAKKADKFMNRSINPQRKPGPKKRIIDFINDPAYQEVRDRPGLPAKPQQIIRNIISNPSYQEFRDPGERSRESIRAMASASASPSDDRPGLPALPTRQRAGLDVDDIDDFMDEPKNKEIIRFIRQRKPQRQSIIKTIKDSIDMLRPKKR